MTEIPLLEEVIETIADRGLLSEPTVRHYVERHEDQVWAQHIGPMLDRLEAEIVENPSPMSEAERYRITITVELTVPEDQLAGGVKLLMTAVDSCLPSYVRPVIRE